MLVSHDAWPPFPFSFLFFSLLFFFVFKDKRPPPWTPKKPFEPAADHVVNPASRGCLDLLNDSVSDMPEHEKERLVDWLHDHSNRRKRSGIFKRASGF